jgi:hypothetical protein
MDTPIVPRKGYRKHLPVGMGYCLDCGLKPESEFNKDKRNTNGLKHRCRTCSHDHYADTQKDNNKLSMRTRNLRVKFDLTETEYQQLLKSQQGVCAICGQPETKILRGFLLQLCVDHDHDTGVIRGLLCNACNVGLGYFKDKIDSLSQAIVYLSKT